MEFGLEFGILVIFIYIFNLNNYFMKKFLSVILISMALLFAVNTQTQAQSSLYVQGGWSWSEGVAAVGYSFGSISSSLGLMVAPMPGSGDAVSGLVWNIKFAPEWDESGYYAGYSYNSVGYRSQIDYGSGWTNDYVAGMHIVSLGYKVGTDVWYLAADVGYGWSPDGSGVSYGVVLGFPLFGNY